MEYGAMRNFHWWEVKYARKGRRAVCARKCWGFSFANPGQALSESVQRWAIFLDTFGVVSQSRFARKSWNDLPCAGADEDDGYSAAEDFEVEPERPVINIFQVEADPIIEVRDFVATTDLPCAG